MIPYRKRVLIFNTVSSAEEYLDGEGSEEPREGWTIALVSPTDTMDSSVLVEIVRGEDHTGIETIDLDYCVFPRLQEG